MDTEYVSIVRPFHALRVKLPFSLSIAFKDYIGTVDLSSILSRPLYYLDRCGQLRALAA